MRYFLEVAYKGTNYAGFQVQQNANTIQAEVERALQICLRRIVKLTGASRTDAGVIERIWITIKDRSPIMLRSIRIDMYWDGAEKPAVCTP